MIGIIPYNITITTAIIYTITISFSIIYGITHISIYYYGYKFINIFIPKGVGIITPILVIIEIISYIFRIFSLSIRLSANIISGHTLLVLFSLFSSPYTMGFYIIGLIPLYILELGVSIIQAYVLVVLIKNYISNNINI